MSDIPPGPESPRGQLEVRGGCRTRYCRQCPFSCSDARSFSAHQATHQPKKYLKIPPKTRNSLKSKLVSLLPDSLKSKSQKNIPQKVTVISATDMPPVPSPSPNPISMEMNMSQSYPSTGSAEPSTSPAAPHKSTEGSESRPEVISRVKFEPEEHMEDDQDEPDSMAPVRDNKMASSITKFDTSKLFPVNAAANHVNVDEEMDDEGKLVIDDCNNLTSTPKFPSNFPGNFTSPKFGVNHNYSCQICPFTTSSSKQYLRHCNDLHNYQATVFECDMCDYATIYKHKLPKHKKQHFSEENEYDKNNSTLDLTGRLDDRSNNFLGVHSGNTSRVATPDTPSMQFTGEEDMSRTPSSLSVPLHITTDNIDQVLDDDKKKKKKTRQEVDPGKYFEAVDGSGTKYACSQCGNIYKWRKSLNKHWKEKHLKDPLVEEPSPPGMLELLKSGKYTQLGARRIYDNAFLATIKTNKGDDSIQPSSSPRSIPSPSPPNFLSSAHNLASINSSLVHSVASAMMPRMVGPFIANTAQPVFPGMAMLPHHLALQQAQVQAQMAAQNHFDNHEEGALDLTRDTIKTETSQSHHGSPYSFVGSHDSSFEQDQPLDFSKKTSENTSTPIKKEQFLDDISKPERAPNHLKHRCTKCDYTTGSEIDFANHTSSHLNKRIVRCFECKIQLNSMDELNAHFIQTHNKKLADHKEAIKKIPHGLQQTYHLLQMDINKIGDLGNQDLGASDAKSLKCKKCDFEAKWPAELQKHAVSHSEERPYICMVCGSTYKWKWDLVKHFQKSHPNLPNPYRRNDKRDSPEASSEDEIDDEPETKRARMAAMNINMQMMNGLYNRDDAISVEGIMAATQAGQRFVSSQPLLDDDTLERNQQQMAFFNAYSYLANAQNPNGLLAHRMGQEIRNRQNQQNQQNQQNANAKKVASIDQVSPGSTPSNSSLRNEDLPYKCTMCNYHARWPSEVTQHMKNHSDSKPYLCPNCEYRSKWKWDVVKHLKRCGDGGTIDDVIDTTKQRRDAAAGINAAPPNAVVSQQGKVKKTTPQPSIGYIMPTVDAHGQPSAMVVRPSQDMSAFSTSTEANNRSDAEMNGNNNNNSMSDNNVNNNYFMYSNGQSLPTQTPNISSLNATPIPSSQFSPIAPPQASPVASLPTPPSSSRNVNAETWICQYCPFSTQSQAELKRHAGLHCEDKPFKCDTCQYATRWACDLKKHRKSYNHYPVTTPNKTNNTINCQDSPAKTPTKPEKSHRFKCAQCSLYFNSLQGLLDHRAVTHIGDGALSSPTPTADEHEIDAARIKHPRKPMKQISCPKCQFVCRNRITMDRHMEEHELQDSSLNCFYCTLQFKNKEHLLDHIISHPMFNPKEWETFFMLNEDEEEELMKSNSDNKTNIEVPSSADDKLVTETIEKKPTVTHEDTDARIQQILNEIPKQQKLEVPQADGKAMYKCEWCPAEFINLTMIHKHAQLAHPIQLKEQDVGSQPQPTQEQKKIQYSLQQIEMLRHQITENTNRQMMDKFQELLATNPKMQEVMTKKMTEEAQKGKGYYCNKCSFTSPHLNTLHQHYALHGSKGQFQCWFCDYAVDQLPDHYQHMKITHTNKWKVLSNDPNYADQIQKLKMEVAKSKSSYQGNNNASPPGPAAADGVMDLSAKTPKQESDATVVAHDIIYLPRQQFTWSGIPVNVAPVGNALNFFCPHCAFTALSIHTTVTHVMSSHPAMSTYKCKTCSLADNNIQVLSEHCKIHPAGERVVEVIEFKQIDFNDLHMVQMKAREKMAMEFAAASHAQAVQENATSQKLMNCPFCPYKSPHSEDMKSHLSSHSQKSFYQCDMCDFSSEQPLVITEHVKVHSKNYQAEQTRIEKPQYKEESQEDAPQNLSTLDASKDTSPRIKSSGRMRYRCTACPYHTTCKSNIVKHKRQHLHNKKYKCLKCSYSAARAVLLKRHIDSHDLPVEADGYHHDVFCNPNSPNDSLSNVGDEENDQEIDMETEDVDDDDNSDVDSEMDAKAIAELEAKTLLEAETAHKASLIDDIKHSDSTGDKPLRKQKCAHCPFSSNSSHEFRKHLNFHGTQERYKCDLCSYSLDRLNLLSQHRRLHCAEPGFNPNPSASALLNTSFILQQNKDNSEESLACESCPFKTAEKYQFENHTKSHGLKKPFICDFCDWSADVLDTVLMHRTIHEAETTYISTREEKFFLNQEFSDCTSEEFEAKCTEVKNTEKESESAIVPPLKLSVVKKSYSCRLCPFKTTSRSSHSVHKSMHGSGAEYSCPQCTYSVSNKGLLQQHSNLHTPQDNTTSPSPASGNSNVNASVNGKDEAINLSSKNSSDCKTPPGHGDQETDGQTMLCPLCPFSSRVSTVLTEHLKTHPYHDKVPSPDSMNNNRSLTSPVADKNRPQVVEMVKPAPTRIYVCRYCDREFEAKTEMLSHEKQHVDV